MKLAVTIRPPGAVSALAEYQAPVPDSVMPAAKPDAEGGGHYYSVKMNETGAVWTPLYAPEKSFTLREARALNGKGVYAVPSVTTYFGVLAKPQLERWKTRNAAEAALDEGILLGTEPFKAVTPADKEAAITRALTLASTASRGAMDLGTRIHSAIEAAVAGKEYDASMRVYVDAVMRERLLHDITTSHPEECMGSLKYGFAGRCDDYTDDMLIIDYKSRKSRGKKVPTYETDAIQLAAYLYARFGNEGFRRGGGSIYAISTTTPGLVTVHNFTGAELIPAFQAFLSLTATWRYMNNFDPRVLPGGITTSEPTASV